MLSSRRAVFLDRDGTLNVEVNHLRRAEDLVLVPGVGQALVSLKRQGFLLVAVTNQAAIARGLLDETELDAIHEQLQALLTEASTSLPDRPGASTSLPDRPGASTSLPDRPVQDARLDAIYFCPHHPEFTGPCACRKPLPGMLLRAAAEHGIDLARSWMVGDTAADVAAGRAAGCRSILVRTGYGASYVQSGAGDGPEVVVDDIEAAVQYILSASTLK